jgi:hypothetical protein
MSKDNSKKPFDSFFASSRNLPNGGGSWAAWNKPSEPERIYIAEDRWPPPKKRTDLIFAKSCISGKWCRTEAGTAPEPTSNFGNVMVAGAMLIPSANTAIATALGADLALGRMAGGGIMQQGLSWALRGAGGPASIFILGMLPAKMGDGTLYTDNQLRNMTHAPTRVRFQFRRDVEGTLQIYGIHTGASGDDTVRTVQATWNAGKTAMETKLNGITILWTPRRSGLVQMPPLVYPDNNGGRLGTILVHPIPDGTDSQIEGLPGEDITTDDYILVFPADTGLNSLYVVFTKPIKSKDHDYYDAPDSLPAYPDAVGVRPKSGVQGGGKKRERWKDRKGRIYEWDSKTGAIEMYDKQGKHLGEFDHVTGEQIDPAKSGRTTPK